MGDFDRFKEQIKQFNVERDWDQFHQPKDLLLALMTEVGELAECYHWASQGELQNIRNDPKKKEAVGEEIADIVIYLIMLAYKTDIDISKAIERKIEKNKLKYPSGETKGIHSKRFRDNT